MASDKQSFFELMWPNAQRAGQATGVDPRIIFAQSALETGWGKSAPNNNYFGIKGSGGTQTTREFLNGAWTTVRDSFRGYSSASDSADGYAAFINSNPRYNSLKDAVGIEAQLDALGRSGYATDPNYTGKLASIIDSVFGEGTTGSFAGSVASGLLGGAKTLPGVGGALSVASLFSPGMAVRVVAVIIGIALIVIALVVLASNNETVQSAVKTALPIPKT